jgi:phage shock protein B
LSPEAAEPDALLAKTGRSRENDRSRAREYTGQQQNHNTWGNTMLNSSTIWILIPLTALMIPIIGIVSGVLKERYRAQQKNITDEDRDHLADLTRVADSLASRITILESILDAEVPDWRDDHAEQ